MADSVSSTVPIKTDTPETLKSTQKDENQPEDINAIKIIKTESNDKINSVEEVVRETNLPLNHPTASCNSTAEGCRTKTKISTLTTQDEKRLNGVKHMNNDPNHNVFDKSLSTGPEYTVTSDNQIWLECNQYNNTFRAYGGNVRSFQPHSSKLNNQLGSPNHLFGRGGRSPQCPQGRRGGHRNAMNYDRNNEYVVHLHVNPGETISFDMGDHVQLIPGPATVRMVSSNSTPPMPMPVQVPPGHMVQQIVDEHGTLRHIILSPQPPVSVNTGNPYSGNTSGNVTSPISGSAPFYLYPHPSFSVHAQFPPHMQPGLGAQGLHGSIDPMQLHQTNGHAANPGLADSASSHLNAFKDERTQRQFFKLKKRLEARHKDSPAVNHGTTERSPERLNNVNDASESRMSESGNIFKACKIQSRKLESILKVKFVKSLIFLTY